MGFSSAPVSVEKSHEKSSKIALTLIKRISEGFVGREEEAIVVVLALVSKQHAVLIGEPGTAKSALIRRLSQLVNAKFFYYLISKYTVPDELIGPIDPVAYKQGIYKRNITGRLPEAELAFIDEVFKGSSETLNTLLNIMNERIFVDVDGTTYKARLWSLYGASNEIPIDSELRAFYDRFLIKHFVRSIPGSAIEAAILHNIENLNENVDPVASMKDIEMIYNEITAFLINNRNAVAKVVAQLVNVLRQHGIFISDRTATSPNHLPRLVASYAYMFNTDIKRAAIKISKYVLPDEESFEKYKNALDSLYPPELREAQNKLEKAYAEVEGGNIEHAKRLALEAIQLAQSLMDNPDKIQLFRDEISEIISSAEKLAAEIEVLKKQLKEKIKKF